MLLPSALSCPRPARRPQLQASLFTSPPASPPPLNVSTHLFQACLSLQSLLQSPQPKPALAPSPFFNEPMQPSQERPEQRQQQRQRQLPTPPMRNAVLPSPMKLRLRSHSNKSATSPMIEASSSQPSQGPRKRVVKRSPPPRGVNKRRRDDEDDDMKNENDEVEMAAGENRNQGPSTPKRIRVAPEEMPLGLERRDFEMLHQSHQYTSRPLGMCLPPPRNLKDEIPENSRNPSIDWTNEEDRQLVELVLQKMRLNKSDWQECARSLGRESGNLQRRWQSLLGAGEVGLRGRARGERSSNSATWR